MPPRKNDAASPYLLIDADVLAYRAASAVEKIVSFDGDNHFPLASLAEAEHAFFTQLSTLLDRLDTDDYALCFSDDHNGGFRRRLFPGYKANRDGKPRPVVLHALREKLMHGEYRDGDIYIKPGLEADDCIGILATYPHFQPRRRKVVVSVDKDMKSIPGFFFDMGKPDLGIREITREDADLWHMTQTLIGDAADGYPGCPKVGPMTARKLFDGIPRDCEHLWPVVVKAFEERGLTEDDALVQARLARILRAEDWNFNTREVKLWQPPHLARTR